MAQPTTTEASHIAGPAIEFKDLSPIARETSTEKKEYGETVNEDVRAEVIPPPTAVDVLQKWNEPRINMWRVFATFYSFIIFGMSDGAYGLESYYSLSYTVVSLVFLSPFAGYTIASTANNWIHVRFGQRGIALAGPLCHLIAFIVFAVHPPYPVLVIMYILVGFGNGIIDAAWSAWLGNMANGNQASGFLHSCYALGATISPLVVSGLTAGGREWYVFYYIMIAGAAVELVTSSAAFWAQSGAVYQAENPRSPDSKTGRTREAIKNKLTWLFALFVFGYIGAEVSLGGWIVTFMLRVRSATSFQSGASSTGFWAGMTVGRITLSFLTARIGEYVAVILYLSICLALQLIFWLIPSFVVSAVAVALLGMFLGPLFPTAIVLVTKMMPRDLHIGAVGFATALGGSGGAIFPFVVGAIAQARGVRMLQPVILALFVAIAGLWLSLPVVGRREKRGLEEEEERERERNLVSA